MSDTPEFEFEPLANPKRLRGQGGGNRTKHQPTAKSRAEVKALASFAIAKNKIARYIGVSPLILDREYSYELEMGEIEANAAVAKSLFQMATKGGSSFSCTAAIFWLKVRGGWRTADEQQLHEQIEVLQKQVADAEERMARLTRPQVVRSA